MLKVSNFKLHLPARVFFKTQKKGDECIFLGGLVPFTDFQILLQEKPSQAAKRIFRSTGLRIAKEYEDQPLFSTKEPLSDKQRRQALLESKISKEDQEYDGATGGN